MSEIWIPWLLLILLASIFPIVILIQQQREETLKEHTWAADNQKTTEQWRDEQRASKPQIAHKAD